MKLYYITLIFCLMITGCTSDNDSMELDLHRTYEVIDRVNNTRVGTLKFNNNSGYVMTCTDQFNPEENRGIENRVTSIIGSYKVIGKEITLNDLIVANVKFFNRWGEEIEPREELFEVTSPGRRVSLPFCRKAIVDADGFRLYVLGGEF